jgi:DNA adenine methylase
MTIIQKRQTPKPLMRPPVTYYGGKQMMLRHLLPNIPTHITYVEPFFGGGALLFAKEKSNVEVINDINRMVIIFYEQCKLNFTELQSLIQATPHSRAAYRDALVVYDAPHLFSDVKKAWAFWVLTNQGYAGKIGTWGYGTISGERERSLHHKRDNFVEDIRDRLDRVQIECNDALHIMELRDRTTTFFYVDPPYFNSNMGHYGGYTEADFDSLLKLLAGIEGKFLLSSYPSELLAKYTTDNKWHTLEVPMSVMASKNRKQKIEVLTANFEIVLGE